MSIKSSQRRPLSAEDSVLLRLLIEENDKTVKAVIYSTLGEQYSYVAEEAVAELYLLACEKINKIKTYHSPKAWLMIAAKRVAWGVIKKHKKDLRVAAYDALSEESSKDDVFEDAVYAIWIEDKVPEKIIALLTKREREVYHKLYIEEKSPAEAAEELGVKINLINNVRKNLKDKIKDAVKQNKF